MSYFINNYYILNYALIFFIQFLNRKLMYYQNIGRPIVILHISYFILIFKPITIRNNRHNIMFSKTP